MDSNNPARRVVVVTGGGSGIGHAMSEAFSAAGDAVVVADIELDRAASLAAELSARGGEALGIRVDVSSLESVTALADAAYERFGRVDVLCNNAGVSMRPYRATWNASAADYAWLMGINYFGVVHGTLAFVPRMRAQDGHKHIVNTASVTALDIAPGHAPYAATKAAVVALSDALRFELSDHGDDFGVTVLYPGLIRTDIATSERLRPQGEESAARAIAEYVPARAAERDYNRPMAASEVGPMVVEAVAKRWNAVHTHGFPEEEVASRIAGQR